MTKNIQNALFPHLLNYKKNAERLQFSKFEKKNGDELLLVKHLSIVNCLALSADIRVSGRMTPTFIGALPNYFFNAITISMIETTNSCK